MKIRRLRILPTLCLLVPLLLSCRRPDLSQADTPGDAQTYQCRSVHCNAGAQHWHIDSDHVLYWNDEPYTPFGLHFYDPQDLPLWLSEGVTEYTIVNSRLDCVLPEGEARSEPDQVALIAEWVDQIERGGGTYTILFEDVLSDTNALLKIGVYNTQQKHLGDVQRGYIPGFKGEAQDIEACAEPVALGGLYDLPLFYRPEVQALYRDHFRAFRDALSRQGLRMIRLINEQGFSSISLENLEPEEVFEFGYPYVQEDPLLAKRFTEFLLRFFQNDLAELNRYYGEQFSDFSVVPWYLPDDDFSNVDKSNIDDLQAQFWLDVNVQGFAEIAVVAKEELGNVPVLVGSWSPSIDQPLFTDPNRLHDYEYYAMAAMRTGVIDGFAHSYLLPAAEDKVLPLLQNGAPRHTRAVQDELGRNLILWIHEAQPVPPVGKCQDFLGWFNAVFLAGYTGLYFNDVMFRIIDYESWFDAYKTAARQAILEGQPLPESLCEGQDFGFTCLEACLADPEAAEEAGDDLSEFCHDYCADFDL